MINELYYIYIFILYVLVGAAVICKAFIYVYKDDNELYKDKAVPILIMTMILMGIDYYFYLKTGLFLFLGHIVPILQIQRYSDVKTKTVYVLINKLFLCLCIIDVVIFCKFNIYMIVAMIIECLILYFMYLKDIFGHGDFIAMCGIAIITQVMLRPINYWMFGTINFLVFLLISNLATFIYGYIQAKKENKKIKEMKVAFYPFMELGYLATTLSAITNYITI